MLFGRISFRGEACGPANKEKERKEKKGKRIRLKSRQTAATMKIRSCKRKFLSPTSDKNNRFSISYLAKLRLLCLSIKKTKENSFITT